MRLLTYTFFTLLLNGSAGSSGGKEIGTVNYNDDSIYVGERRYGVYNENLALTRKYMYILAK